MKRIVLTGGGTAGHVTPHLALLPQLQQNFEVHYIGTNGIEYEILKKYPGVVYHKIEGVKLIRSLTLKNLQIPFKLIASIRKTKKLLQQLKPSVVFSKGGYVSVPVVYAASSLKIPIISHESDITMGLANKLILKKCDIMCCSFSVTAKKCDKKCVFSGSPIRNELFTGNKQKAQEVCKFANLNKPCILFMGGSLGASAINKTVMEALPQLTKTFNVIHIVGKGNKTKTTNPSYCQIEFTNQIEHFFSLANFIVSRAGSNSIFEFLALKKPMLLIPLPKDQSRGDQILNAQEFEKQHFCHVLYQQNLNKDTLLQAITKLQQEQHSLTQSMASATLPNGINTLYTYIKLYSNLEK